MVRYKPEEREGERNNRRGTVADDDVNVDIYRVGDWVLQLGWVYVSGQEEVGTGGYGMIEGR